MIRARRTRYDDGAAVLVGLESDDELEDFVFDSDEPLDELALLDDSLLDEPLSDEVLLDESLLDELPLSEFDDESEVLLGGELAEFLPERESFR